MILMAAIGAIKGDKCKFMKVKNEIEKDVFSWKYLFNKSKIHHIVAEIPDLSAFSIVATMIFCRNDKDEFIKICGEKLKTIYSNEAVFSNYKMWLIVNLELQNPKSRVERYKKIWKVFESQCDISGFTIGSEIEIDLGGAVYYSSVAEVNINDVSKALKILDINKECILVISNRNLDKPNIIQSLFDLMFVPINNKRNLEVDWLNISMRLCPQGDFLIRLADSSEEAGMDIIFSAEMLPLFSKYI
jgi:hypothetical protein